MLLPQPAARSAADGHVLDRARVPVLQPAVPDIGAAQVPAPQDGLNCFGRPDRFLGQLVERERSPAALEVDGGITVETIRTAWAAGADTFVAGTAVFGARDPAAAIRALRAQCSVSV